MNADGFGESLLENAHLGWLQAIGLQLAHGFAIVAGMTMPKRRERGDDAQAEVHIPALREAR